MKYLLSLLSLVLLTVVYGQDAPVFEEPKNGPKLVFEEEKFDFGDITQGDVVEHVFEFTNAGNEPLILQDVKTTCGCTVPVWPREPIAPGESGSITVKFNSRGKIGVQNKVVTIMSNDINQRSRVMITTNVGMKTEGEG